MVVNLPDNAGDARDLGSIPGLGRSLGGGNGYPLQYFCLDNPMDRGAWWATALGVAKSRTPEQLSTAQQTVGLPFPGLLPTLCFNVHVTVTAVGTSILAL